MSDLIEDLKAKLLHSTELIQQIASERNRRTGRSPNTEHDYLRLAQTLLTRAKTADGFLNSPHLHQIHTDTENAHDIHPTAGCCIACFISRTADSMPTRRARETIEWPMFNSLKCGNFRILAMFW